MSLKRIALHEAAPSDPNVSAITKVLQKFKLQVKKVELANGGKYKPGQVGWGYSLTIQSPQDGKTHDGVFFTTKSDNAKYLECAGGWGSTFPDEIWDAMNDELNKIPVR